MNIIMIMSDSLRQDHLGCYGNSWIETPHIDRLASESVLFENAYPEGLPTLPVRTALFTGNYTLTNRFWKQLTPEDVSMAEILDEYGYVSSMITDTYHLFKPNMNYHRGFHEWQWIRGQEMDAYKSKPHSKDIKKYIKPEMEGDYIVRVLDQYFRNVADREKEEDYFVAQVMGQAAQWLEDNHNAHDRFFLYVDSFDPHEPWDPPPTFATKYTDPDYNGPWIIIPKGGPCDWMTAEELKHTRGLYAGEVSFVDKWVGYLLERISDLGLTENSLIIFLSDHGHPLGEHGKVLKMVDQLYSELLRIPLLIRFPGKKHAGKRIKGLVETVDILPTILDFLGHENEGEFMHGKSFLPLITGEADKIHETVTTGFFSSATRCIRDEEWSYIRNDKDEECELYNLIQDPKESVNLIKEDPEKAKEMDEALAKIFNIRYQKEHWFQMKYDVPGLTEGRFNPVRYWKK
jgi:arylsulfatase A-like enzyme